MLNIWGCDLVASVAGCFTETSNYNTLIMTNNDMDSTAVDDFFNTFVAGAWLGGSVYVDTRGNAAPTAASLTARNALIAAGGSVFTD